MDAIAALAAFLEEDKERVARLWAKRLSGELLEGHLSAGELRPPLSRHVNELARLLRERGQDAVRLWPEHVRAHGASRFLQRFDADDVIRELEILQEILLARYARKRGKLEPEVAGFIAQLCGEAAAAVAASYVRSVRTEEVRFREAGTMESILHHAEVGI